MVYIEIVTTLTQLSQMSNFGLPVRQIKPGYYIAFQEFDSIVAAKEYLIQCAVNYNNKVQGSADELLNLLDEIKNHSLTLDTLTVRLSED